MFWGSFMHYTEECTANFQKHWKSFKKLYYFNGQKFCTSPQYYGFTVLHVYSSANQLQLHIHIHFRFMDDRIKHLKIKFTNAHVSMTPKCNERTPLPKRGENRIMFFLIILFKSENCCCFFSLILLFSSVFSGLKTFLLPL